MARNIRARLARFEATIAAASRTGIFWEELKKEIDGYEDMIRQNDAGPAQLPPSGQSDGDKRDE